MNYQERASYIGLVSSVVLSTPFLLFSVINANTQTFSNTGAALIYWSKAILILFILRVFVEIIFQMVLSYATNKSLFTLDTSDERDTLFQLGGMKVTLFSFILGFLASMTITLIIGDPQYLLVIIVGFVTMGDFLGSGLQVYNYRNN